nr:retrovirus-related Pol polyprotein from transposon TNT 1-94 [Tanacetum cinerariifolium]
MIRNLKLLINFVWKFLGTVRFGNDHVAAILGLGDLQWGNILITRVYFVEGLGHNLFLVRQFCDSYLEAEAIATACYTQNRSIIHRRFNKTPYKLINGRKPDISFLHVLGAICYPKNDREDIGKLGTKGDIGFFISYSVDSCNCKVYNRRTKKIIETMNVTFDELSAMALKQISLKLGIQSMTSGHSTMHDDYLGGQPSVAPRTVLAAQAPQFRQTPMASTTIADTASTPTNSSSQATIFPNTSQDVAELETQKQHVQHQPVTIVDNVLNAMFNENTFVNPFATQSTSVAESSSSQYVDPSNMHTNKHDEENIVIQNKTRLVVRGYRQDEGIDSSCCTQSFTVFQTDVKTAFLRGTLKENVYVCQPKGFIDADDPSYVYKLNKAIYGLKQAPRAWYDELSMFFLQNHLFKGIIDLALFIRRFNDDNLVAKLTEKHLKEVKRIFHYLRGIVNTGLWYIKDSGFELTGFSNVDYARCKDTFKSTSGGVQFLATAISCNPVQHSRTKHIVVRYHFIKEHVEKGTTELNFVKTDYHLADPFTKALPVDQFNYLVRHLGMRSLSPQELERLAKSW